MNITSDQLQVGFNVWSDGGAHNNQSAALRQGYGTFAVVNDGQLVESTLQGEKAVYHKFEYGNVTNNVAELETAIHALEYLRDLQARGWKKGFRICCDSQLVIIALTTGVKKPAPQLLPYYQTIRTLIADIQWQLQVVKVHESQVKLLLGH